jgi:hypothetical protein
VFYTTPYFATSRDIQSSLPNLSSHQSRHVITYLPLPASHVTTCIPASHKTTCLPPVMWQLAFQQPRDSLHVHWCTGLQSPAPPSRDSLPCHCCTGLQSLAPPSWTNPRPPRGIHHHIYKIQCSMVISLVGGEASFDIPGHVPFVTLRRCVA